VTESDAPSTAHTVKDQAIMAMEFIQNLCGDSVHWKCKGCEEYNLHGQIEEVILLAKGGPAKCILTVYDSDGSSYEIPLAEIHFD